MALFGQENAFVGLDIGTSSLKVVELIRRRKNIEVATYGQADIGNLLVTNEAVDNEDEVIRQMANVISRLLDTAGVSTDVVVAALPSSVVFSTVLSLPRLPDADMERAVHFAAREVVPANLDEMVLGWSRVGELPHMDEGEKKAAAQPDKTTPAATEDTDAGGKPVFLTAAPSEIVNRYTRLMDLIGLELHALEVETFPLARSLLEDPQGSGVIVDIGDQVTTYHIIDRGTPRVSHTTEKGGNSITAALVEKMSISEEEAERLKAAQGLTGPDDTVRSIIADATRPLITQAKQVSALYAQQSGQAPAKTFLIGGGAKLKGIEKMWSEVSGQSATIGNPWKGLTYPEKLEARMKELGTTYAVTVGLAQRGFTTV